ncbi:TetR/AcrR family transcriptional regulator [Vibrio fortis]
MTVKKTLSQKKREAIVEAAIAEFTENGYKSTSMDKISARAEVSKRNLSRVLFSEYFHNKELAYQAMEKYSQAESGLTIWIKAALADERLIELDPHFASTQFIALLKSFAFWPQIIGHAPSPDTTQRNHIIDSSVQMFLKQYQR